MEPCYREVVKKAARGKDEKVSLGVVDASPARASSLYTTTVDNDLTHSGDKWSPR